MPSTQAERPAKYREYRPRSAAGTREPDRADLPPRPQGGLDEGETERMPATYPLQLELRADRHITR